MCLVLRALIFKSQQTAYSSLNAGVDEDVEERKEEGERKREEEKEIAGNIHVGVIRSINNQHFFFPFFNPIYYNISGNNVHSHTLTP